MDFLFLPASFSPINLAAKPSLLPPPRASYKPPPEASALPPAAVRRPLSPSLRQPSPATPTPSISEIPTPDPAKPPKPPAPNPLAPKLWLSSKLAPPPPPPPPPPPLQALSPEPNVEDLPLHASGPGSSADAADFRVKGKIFVGNLPRWVKKNEVAEFFRQFGPIKKAELIRDHDDPERNMGYCFLLYGGPTAEDAAARAVEFDGVEFRGRILTVRLDDGSQLRTRKVEKERWVAGSNEREYRSKWHEERANSSIRFMKILDTKPDDWQAVVSAFDKIPKV